MKRALPYFLLIAEAVLFFRQVLFVPGRIIPWDLHSLHLPYGYLYAESLARGEFPLWDPYTYCGRPLFATIQAAVLYPTVGLAAALGNFFGREHIFYLLELSVVLHVALAGIFAFLLGRRLGLGTAAALFGATVYELSGFFAAHTEHMGVVICAAWLPLAWYAALRWHEERGRRPFLMLAGAFALSIFSGNPPGAAFLIGFTILFAALLPRASWRLPAMIAGAAAVAVLLTVVQLVPTFELTGNSIARYRGDYLKGGVPPQVFVSLLLPDHYHLFDPAHYNGPADLSFMYLYCGLLPLLLVVVGIALAWRSRLHLIFTAVLACSAVAALGDMTRVTHFLYGLLPSKIVIGLHPELACGPFTLALAMLAALTLQQLLPRRRLRWAAVAVAAVDLIVVSSGRPMNAMPFNENPGDLEAAARLRTLTDADTPPSRIDTVDDTLEWAMTAPMTGVYTANGADVMAPERIIQARLAFCRGKRWGSFYQVENPHSPVLGMMNVRYLLSRTPLPDQALGTLPGRSLYENRAVLPRFRLVAKVRTAGTMQEAAAMLKAADFRPAEEAIVEGPTGRMGSGPPGSVEVVEYGLQSVQLKVQAPADRYLVSSETHYPGWKASVDGRPEPIHYTNVAFRGLWVPAGNHTVTMRFQPDWFIETAVLSGLAWLLWLGLWWFPATSRATAAGPRPVRVRA